MPKRTKLLGKKIRRGERMRGVKGWRLVSPGRRRVFKASLITTFQAGAEKLALFRVLLP